MIHHGSILVPRPFVDISDNCENIAFHCQISITMKMNVKRDTFLLETGMLIDLVFKVKWKLQSFDDILDDNTDSLISNLIGVNSHDRLVLRRKIAGFECPEKIILPLVALSLVLIPDIRLISDVKIPVSR